MSILAVSGAFFLYMVCMKRRDDRKVPRQGMTSNTKGIDSFADNLVRNFNLLPTTERLRLTWRRLCEEETLIERQRKERVAARGNDGPKPGDVYHLWFEIQACGGDVIDVELVCIEEKLFLIADTSLCSPFVGDIERMDNGIKRVYHTGGPAIEVYDRHSVFSPENRWDVVGVETLEAIDAAQDQPTFACNPCEDNEEWRLVLHAHYMELRERGAYDHWFHNAEEEDAALQTRPQMDRALDLILYREEVINQKFHH